MLNYKPVFDECGKLLYIETNLVGNDLLTSSKLNKGFAFTAKEREEFGLLGKLPYTIESLEEQASRVYMQYQLAGTNIAKNIFLNDMHDNNEVLFFKLVSEHLKEMLPIIYTPTMGDVVEKLTTMFHRSRGLYLSYPDRDKLDTILDNRMNPEIDLIVMTDGERILGMGDQGVCGMMIPIAKLMVYTACGGVNPYRMLPIQLDVGTNNQRLLSDPLYYGWRHPRLEGKEYDDFIDQVVNTIQKKFPHIYLHWEDFGRDNARRNLERFRDLMCTFNDDMQGTGAVCLASVLAAVNASKSHLPDHRVIMYGAGTAGVGIADQICAAMMRTGVPADEARAHFWLIDRPGLLLKDTENLLPFQQPYARDAKEVTGWAKDIDGKYNLAEVVKHIKPTILIGTSTQGGAFTQEIVQTMAANVERPIIFPLSNPTEKAEAAPANILNWTKGKALVATGSPFADVNYGGRIYPISQCNNSYVFPGIGLGIIVSKAKRLTDNMIWMAAKTLSDFSPAIKTPGAPILPDLNDVHKISKQIALAVAQQARVDNVTGAAVNADFEKLIAQSFWTPHYVPYHKIK